MKRIVSKVAAMLMACMMLAGCSGSNDKAVATVNGTAVSSKDLTDVLEYMLAYEGITITDNMSDEDKKTVDELKEKMLDEMIRVQVQIEKAKEDGLNQFTEEEQESISSQTRTMMDNWYAAFQSEVEGEGKLTGAEAATEAKKRYDEHISSNGYTEEYVRQSVEENLMIEKLYEKYAESIEPTEEQLRAKYDEQVASEKETYGGDAASYVLDVTYASMTGANPVYKPAGLRRVRHILVGISSEEQENIAKLEEEGKTEEAEQARSTALQAALTKANEVRGQLAADGSNFTEIMEKETADLDSLGQPNMPDGYYMEEGNTSYAESFVKASFALAKVGDISQPIESTYGYHIIRLEEITEEGATPFEELSDSVKETYTSEVREEAYNKLIDEWMAAMKIDKFPENIVLPSPEPSPSATAETSATASQRSPEDDAPDATSDVVSTPTPSATGEATATPSASAAQ